MAIFLNRYLSLTKLQISGILFQSFVTIHHSFMQEITGVFMRNCMLHYAAYKNIFPLWALAEYCKRVPLPSKKI
jgi:hypothetical protein